MRRAEVQLVTDVLPSAHELFIASKYGDLHSFEPQVRWRWPGRMVDVSLFTKIQIVAQSKTSLVFPLSLYPKIRGILLFRHQDLETILWLTVFFVFVFFLSRFLLRRLFSQLLVVQRMANALHEELLEA